MTRAHYLLIASVGDRGRPRPLEPSRFSGGSARPRLHRHRLDRGRRVENPLLAEAATADWPSVAVRDGIAEEASSSGKSSTGSTKKASASCASGKQARSRSWARDNSLLLRKRDRRRRAGRPDHCGRPARELSARSTWKVTEVAIRRIHRWAGSLRDRDRSISSRVLTGQMLTPNNVHDVTCGDGTDPERECLGREAFG